MLTVEQFVHEMEDHVISNDHEQELLGHHPAIWNLFNASHKWKLPTVELKQD